MVVTTTQFLSSKKPALSDILTRPPEHGIAFIMAAPGSYPRYCTCLRNMQGTGHAFPAALSLARKEEDAVLHKVQTSYVG